MTSQADNPQTSNVRVHRHQDWSPEAEKFQFMDEPMRTQSGGLAVGFRYDGTKLRVKTPKLRVPFGLQTGMDGKGFNIQLAFSESEAGQQFLQQCQRFDEIIEQAGLDNPDKWFSKNKSGKPPSAAVIKDKFYPMVKLPSNDRYQPTFKIKLPSKKVSVPDPDNPEAVDGKIEIDAFQCKLFDKDKNQLSIDDDTLCGGSYVTVLMSCSSIWSTTTGFGATWKAEQIMVFPGSNSQLPDHCLLDMESSDDDSDESEAENVAVEPKEVPTEVPTEEPTEEQVEVNEEPEVIDDSDPEPEPELVKKPATRTKKTPTTKK